MTQLELPRQGRNGYGTGGSGEMQTSNNGGPLQLDTVWYEPKGGKKKADAYNQLMILPKHRPYVKAAIAYIVREQTRQKNKGE